MPRPGIQILFVDGPLHGKTLPVPDPPSLWYKAVVPPEPQSALEYWRDRPVTEILVREVCYRLVDNSRTGICYYLLDEQQQPKANKRSSRS